MLEKIQSVDRDLYVKFLNHLLTILPEETTCKTEFYLRKKIPDDVEINASINDDNVGRYYDELGKCILKIGDINEQFGFNFHPDLHDRYVQFATGQVYSGKQYILDIFNDLYPRMVPGNPRFKKIGFSCHFDEDENGTYFTMTQSGLEIYRGSIVRCMKIFGDFLNETHEYNENKILYDITDTV